MHMTWNSCEGLSDKRRKYTYGSTCVGSIYMVGVMRLLWPKEKHVPMKQGNGIPIHTIKISCFENCFSSSTYFSQLLSIFRCWNAMEECASQKGIQRCWAKCTVAHRRTSQTRKVVYTPCHGDFTMLCSTTGLIKLWEICWIDTLFTVTSLGNTELCYFSL